MTLRYREAFDEDARDEEGRLSWSLGKFREPASPVDASITIGGTAPLTSFTHDKDDHPLTLERLYAIQFVYEARRIVGDTETDRMTAYAVRDAFVWPAGGPPAPGSRIGTVPLNVEKGNRSPSFNICDSTFAPDGRIGDWRTVIDNSFEHWQDALPPRFISSSYAVGGCTDYYSGIYDGVTNAVLSALDLAGVIDIENLEKDALDEIELQVNNLIDAMSQDIMLKNREDRTRNEIIMYDDVGLVLTALRRAAIFS